MKKSTLTRFDNENIVFVEIENQEGTAKIIDEVNNTVIDIGGGGGAAFLIDPQEITISVPDSAFPEIQVNDGGEGRLPDVEFILLKSVFEEEARYYVLTQQSANEFVYSDESEIFDLLCDSDTHIWHIFYGEETGGDEPEPVTGTFTFSAVGTW